MLLLSDSWMSYTLIDPVNISYRKNLRLANYYPHDFKGTDIYYWEIIVFHVLALQRDILYNLNPVGKLLRE